MHNNLNSIIVKDAVPSQAIDRYSKDNCVKLTISVIFRYVKMNF
jgi:hypothetical protein